jgi:hypothetical protein
LFLQLLFNKPQEQIAIAIPDLAQLFFYISATEQSGYINKGMSKPEGNE